MFIIYLYKDIMRVKGLQNWGWGKGHYNDKGTNT